MSFEEPERVEGEHQEVQGEAVFRGYDLPPGQWFATRNGDLHRLHDSLWHRRDFVHDLLQQPFFREEVRRANMGEPVTERFANFILTLAHEDVHRCHSHVLLALASGLFHLRLGAASPLQHLKSWDILARILPLNSSSASAS